MSSKIDNLYTIRDYVEADRNFILATFLRGLYYGNEFYNMIPKQAFMDNYKQVGEVLLSRAVVKIACLTEDPDVILGYSIVSQDHKNIHWCFVKAAWRKQGIGKSLLPQSPENFTHFTSLGLSLIKKYNNLTFNPFLQ
jgi:GNAT superfamily N-acetyltransferase